MKLKSKGGKTISVLVLMIPAVLMCVRYGILGWVTPGLTRAYIIGDVSLLVVLAPLIAILVSALYRRGCTIRELDADLLKKTTDLILANEKERRKIALALHDRVGQDLACSRKKLERMAGSCSGRRWEIESVVALIDQTMSDIRTLNFDISPHILYDEGLEGALDWLCEQVEEERGVRIEFEDDLTPKPLTEDSRILLYRCSRELILNVARHSRATLARVRVGCENNSVRIDVLDDGVGFNPQQLKKGPGFGLSSIFGQVRHHGGDVFVESAPEKGARVSIVYPLDGVA